MCLKGTERHITYRWKKGGVKKINEERLRDEKGRLMFSKMVMGLRREYFHGLVSDDKKYQKPCVGMEKVRCRLEGKSS